MKLLSITTEARNRVALAVLSIVVFAVGVGDHTSAHSQTLMDKFDKDRIGYRKVTGEACGGSEAAVKSLMHDAFEKKNAVALSNIAWLGEHLYLCVKAKFKYDAKLVSDGYRMSHKKGYPIGSFYFGRSLISGNHDLKQDVSEAVKILEKSLTGGYARAGSFLAETYLVGNYNLESDLNRAESYLN